VQSQSGEVYTVLRDEPWVSVLTMWDCIAGTRHLNIGIELEQNRVV
jgi:hypothetical protein